MKATSWILVAFAVVVLGALGGLMLSGGRREPRDLLDSAMLRFHGPEQDPAATLRELETALRTAEAEGDDELASDILIARGRVLRDVDAFGPARSDFERALERYRPGSVDIELEIVRLDEETGDLTSALERALRITERAPERLEAWTRAGQILARISEQRLDEFQRLVESSLPGEASRKALLYARRAAGMEVDDPLRVSQLAGLRSLFTPPDQADSLEAMRLVEQASQATSRARDALAHSFTGQPDREAVQAYFELLARSGRTQDAMDFGLAVASQRTVNSAPGFMERLARVLIDAGRPAVADNTIKRHWNRNVQAGQSFYLTWCEALYKSGRWRDLIQVAQLLRKAGDERHRSIAVFYLGLGQARIGQPEPASNALEFYAQREPVEPFPGALALAWRTVGETWRARGELAKEKAALLQAVKLAPEADGNTWLRLFHILQESEPDQLNKAEEHLTQAIALLPGRTEELMPTWLDIGRRRMRASGTELELLLADQRKTGRVGPAPEAGPYELFRFGEMHREARENVAAAACARRLLVKFPHFLPAMDLLADSLRDIGDWTSAAGIWIERLRLVPGDQLALRRLARLPAGTLTSAQLIEVMQLDPENTGRLEVARTLKSEGRAAEAFAGLDALPLEPLGDEGILLASELLIEIGREADALAMLERLRPASRASARAFELSLDAARLSGRDDLLLEIIARPPPAERLDQAGMIERVDGFFVRGLIEPARALLDFLDGQAATRSRGVLLRGAVLALYDHNMTVVQDELDRAEPFDRSGSVAFGRLLAALEGRQYNRLPIFVRDVYAAGYVPTRLQSTILAILDERLDEAALSISEMRRKEPQEPNWALLAFALDVLGGRTPEVESLVDSNGIEETLFMVRGGDRARNPRPLLARLLALESPEWRLWGTAEFARLKAPMPGSLWATYQVGRGQAAAGLSREAERTWRGLVRTWPTFEPAWNALEQIKLQRLKRFDNVELVRLRADRRLAAGRRPGEEAEEFLTEAWSREIAGNLVGALESVRAAVARDPEFVPALFKLGQLGRRVSRWEESIDALRRAARAASVETASPVVEEFVAVLRDARAAQPPGISAEEVRADLALLAERFPDDPAVALALARAELDHEDISPAVRVARAYEKLDRFRAHIDDMAMLRAISEQAELESRRSTDPAAGSAGDGRVSRDGTGARTGAETGARPSTGASAVQVAGGPAGPRLVRVQRPSLEGLRPGSTAQWKDFYQALEPARAEQFVRAELDRRPGSLELWRMLGETLVAEGRSAEAIRLFELVARMVPDGKTHRALARLYADTAAETARVETAIAAAVRLESRRAPDVDLLYALARALSSLPQSEARGIQVLASLWQQRESALGHVRAEDIGQLYGTVLLQRADPADRLLATNLLTEVAAGLRNDGARKNLVQALAALASQIPARPR